MENEQSSNITRRRFLMAAGAIAALLVLAGAVRQANAAIVRVGASPIVARTSPGYVSFAVDLDQVTGGMFWSQAPNTRGNAPVARYDFARAVGVRVVFGVNAGPGPRDPGGNWDPVNALQLLRYTASRHYPLAAVEFGNEPNLFSLVSGMPAGYTAADYVRDLETFRAVRDRVVPHALLMGPGSYYDNGGSETPYGGHAFGPLASQILPAAPSIY